METHHQNDDIKYHLYNNEAIESKYDALIVWWFRLLTRLW